MAQPKLSLPDRREELSSAVHEYLEDRLAYPDLISFATEDLGFDKTEIHDEIERQTR